MPKRKMPKGFRGKQKKRKKRNEAARFRKATKFLNGFGQNRNPVQGMKNTNVMNLVLRIVKAKFELHVEPDNTDNSGKTNIGYNGSKVRKITNR